MTGRSITPAQYQRITLVALVALTAIIVSGAAVRLTGSGLGCSDWPNCEQGQFVPDRGDLHAAVEFGNRLITGIVSIAVIVAVLGSFRRAPRRADLTWLSLGLVAGVIAQIIVGALVVKTDLLPQAVIAHFLLSMVLLWNALVLYRRAGAEDPGRWQPAVPDRIMNASRVLVAVAAYVLVTGTVVTGTGPHAGDPVEAERLPYFLPDVARIHSLGVIGLGLVAVGLGLWAWRAPGSPGTRLASARLLAVIVAQGAIGYIQYFSGVPALLVAFHVLGAALLWLAVLDFHLSLSAPERAAAPTNTTLVGV